MTDRIRRVDRSHITPSVRATYYQAIAIALLGNGVLLALKAWAARLSGSIALFADAANSASDLAYSVLMMAGLWLSLRPPDRSHPHGHERIESLVSVAIGIFMTLAGIEALRTAARGWSGRVDQPFGLVFALVPVLTALSKGAMYWRVRRLGRSVASPAILASASDHLTDILASVVVLVGLVGAHISFPQADVIAGALVAVWILSQAGRVVLDGIGQLIGRGGSAEAEQAVTQAILGVHGVVGVDKVIIEHVGPRLRADIHVYADGAITLDEAHRISHAVRGVVEALDSIDHAFVHVEPAAKL